MEVVKPARSPDAAKTWGVQEPGNWNITRSYIDHLGRLCMLNALFAGSPTNVPQGFSPARARISQGRVVVESNRDVANYFTFSESLHETTRWSHTNLTVTANADRGPLHDRDRAPKMTRLVATATNGPHQIGRVFVEPLPAGQASVSYVVKRSGTGTGSRYITIITSGGSVGFDLQLVSTTSFSGSATGGISRLFNDSYLVHCSFTHVAGQASPVLALRSTSGAGSQSFAGNGSNGIFAGFAQLSTGAFGTYNPVLSSSIPSTLGETLDTAFPVLASSAALDPLGNFANEWMTYTYTSGSRVIRYGIEYESLLSENTNNDPATSPTWWRRVGPTNAWAMFDDKLNTKTVASEGGLDVAVWISGATCMGFFGLSNVNTVRVNLSAGPGQTVDFFQTYVVTGKRQLVVDIPAGYNLAEVSFTNTAGESLEVGNMVWGTPKSIGVMRYGARAGIRDYSRKEANEYGEIEFVRRNFAKTLSCMLEVEKADLATVQTTLEDFSATPAMWIGAPEDAYSQTLNVYGFYKDFYLSVDYPTLALCSLELEGLI